MALKIGKAAPKSAQVQVEVEKPVQVAKPAEVQEEKQASTGEIMVLGEEEQVDEYMQIAEKLEPFQKLIKRQGELREKFLEVGKEAGEDDPARMVRIMGSDHDVLISIPTESTSIQNMNGLIGVLKKKVGVEALYKLIKITLADVKKYLSEEDAKPYLVTGPGSRRIKGIEAHKE